MSDITAADIAALREQGDFRSFLDQIAGRGPAAPDPVADEPPDFHIPRPGAWPCGTAATGPIPAPHCRECRPNQEGTP